MDAKKTSDQIKYQFLIFSATRDKTGSFPNPASCLVV